MDPGNPVGEALHRRRKYVVSTTLTDPQSPGPTSGLELVDLQSTRKGVMLQTYRVTGCPQYETVTT